MLDSSNQSKVINQARLISSGLSSVEANMLITLIQKIQTPHKCLERYIPRILTKMNPMEKEFISFIDCITLTKLVLEEAIHCP